ncbi:MAG: hypothetical protein HY608_02995 [Planctomycetes bacterium]|nr:hypothetical protein [Planctomycetota bacterium]
MGRTGQPWVIVLAAGEGKRLGSLTRGKGVRPVPKQFCAFCNEKSLLELTIERASRLAPVERIVPIVAEQHWPLWRIQLARIPPENIVAQPVNRDTAPGILLPLMRVLGRDPSARVVILASDHYVEDEEVLGGALATVAGGDEGGEEDAVTLLGFTPDSPDTELGWIIPRRVAGRRVHPVAAFVEKPAPHWAQILMEHGALWNSFLFAGAGQSILRLYEGVLPQLLGSFQFALGTRGGEWLPWRVEALYDDLPSRNFSREILQRAVRHLRVLPVPPCGWTDLGTPERVFEFLAHRETGGEPRLSGPALWRKHVEVPQALEELSATS